MRNLIEKTIKLRNPNFKFDDNIDFGTIISLAGEKAIEYLRSFKVLLRGKRTNKLFLGRGVKFFNLKKISFGKFNKIGEYTKVSALGKQGVIFGNNVSIGAFSRIITSTSFNNIGSHIKIGNNVGIGEFAYLGGAGGLEIDDDCIIGQYLSCHPENHNFSDSDELIRKQGVNRTGIKIGKNCWIGSKVTILDGVEIGNNCVIAAGAVVSKSMPSNSVIGGVPAKVIRKITSRINEAKVFDINPKTKRPYSKLANYGYNFSLMTEHNID